MEVKEAVAAWTHALQRCIESQSHALVDDSIVLVFVDAARVFHPVQAMVYASKNEDDDDAGHVERDPLVVVMRLHPTVAALVRTLVAANVTPEHTDTVLASLLFREQTTAIVNGPAPRDASVPYFASRSVNVNGGALCLFGETQQSASQALTMATLAITSSDEPLTTDVRRLVVVAEHRDGYLARDYSVTNPSSDLDQQPVLSQLLTIQRREWGSGAIAQLSLDDALEAYEAAFMEEQEINGNTEGLTGARSLEIAVSAAFEIREQTRGVRGSTFLVDVEDARGSTTNVPSVVLFSKWEGLENVRSLLCKPPPQSASTLCFSSKGQTSSEMLVPGPRQSLALLRHLEHAIQDGAGHQTWKALSSDSTAQEIAHSFKDFLQKIDQDTFSGNAGGGNDDTTNNTIESTVSVALDGEHRRMLHAVSRADMDPVEKLWEFVARNANGTALTQQLLQEFLVFLSNTRIFPAPHPDNDTELARLVRLRHDEIQGDVATSSFAASAQQMLQQPADAFAFLIEAGEWKMKRDVADALAQAGFSSQECSEFVLAMPRFDVHTHHAPHAHWKAMDHVLQLCTTGLAVQLPVSFMRKAVHDCVAYHARSSGGTSSSFVDPLVLVDLQSFIPDRIRSSIIADPLYWDLRIAFNTDYEHRVHICLDAYHPTVKSANHAQSLLASDELVLDDATLRALHRHIPEELLLQNEMVQFITKLENDREKRLYERLHDIVIPSGMVRYDCTVRRLHVFP